MSRKLVIAVALSVVGASAVLALSRGRLPFYGVGLIVEVLYFFLTACLLWAIQAPALARIGAILVSMVLVAVVGAYLSAAAFGKIDFSIRVVALGFGLHLLATLAFLGLVWLLDHAIPLTRGPH